MGILCKYFLILKHMGSVREISHKYIPIWNVNIRLTN